MTSLASVEVPDFKKVNEGGKEVVFYRLLVSFRGKTWSIDRRYSECEVLVKDLEAVHGKLALFPEKSIFKLRSFEDITKRQKDLEVFFKSIAQRPDMYGNRSFLSFLGLDSKGFESSNEMMILSDSMENKVLGFRGLAYSSELNLLFNILADVSAVSRMDSYLTNWKLPWESKKDSTTEPVFAVGRLELNRISISSKVKMSLTSSQSFTSQAYSCYLSQRNNTIAVGCDDGSAHLFQIDTQSYTIRTLFGDKVGKGRVESIGIDSHRNYLFCFMERGNIETIDLIRKDILTRSFKSRPSRKLNNSSCSL